MDDPRVPKLLTAAAILAFALPARAAPSCHGISVSAMDFGTYDVYAAAHDDTVATISYSCPPPALPLVTVDAGLNSNGSTLPRLLAPATGSDRLQYNVYVDAARTQVWGAVPISVAQGNNNTVSIYGRIFAGQDVAVGTYLDTLTVTFNF